MATQLTQKEQDFLRLIKSGSHLGSMNVNKSMERFINHFTQEGVPIFNLEHTLNKIRLAARVISGFKGDDVIVVSSRENGQRAVIKFASFTGCNATSNARWTPGVLTNYKTGNFQEPRLMVVADTFADRKAIIESSYMNIPVIALANTDSNLQYVDVAIPCNNKSTESVSMIFWLLAREVKILKGEHQRNEPWDIKVDLFYHRTLDQAEEIEKAQKMKEEAENGEENEDAQENWDDDEHGDGEDGEDGEEGWGDEEDDF